MSASIFPDQTRPDQTRPDQHNYTLLLKRIKNILKKVPGLRKAVIKIGSIIDDFKFRKFWANDRVITHFFSRKHFDRIPYILRMHSKDAGLFARFIGILSGIAFTDKNNFIPVVDMKNYPNTYLYDDEVKHVNSWEYYFEQPDNISLEDALSCKKYILGKDTWRQKCMPSFSVKFFYNYDGELDYWRKLCKKYIRFKPEVIERLKILQDRTAGKRILGLLVRGTDYTSLKPRGHHVPPTAEQAISKAQEVMQEKNFDAIYLATEDKNILLKFQKVFGDKLILPDAEYVDYDYTNPKGLYHYITNAKYLRGLEYLVSMLFLSKCQGFITSITGGSIGVMYLSEGFDYLYVFDFGKYE